VFVAVSASFAVRVEVVVSLVIVGRLERTMVLVPVEVCHEATVPFEKRTVLAPPIVVRPVPPEDVGRAVPERVIARVPDEVIGEPVIVRNPNGCW